MYLHLGNEAELQKKGVAFTDLDLVFFKKSV